MLMPPSLAPRPRGVKAAPAIDAAHAGVPESLMMLSAPLLLLSLAAGRASAHDYPIRPVRVTLRVEPDRVAADIRSDSIYWIEEVTGLHPMPASDWPDEALAATERYVNEHLRLSSGGKRLTGRLVAA